MDTGAIEIRGTDEGCRLRVRVRPGARRDTLLGPHGGALKLSVAAPPERGRANDAVEALIAAALGIAVSRVAVVAGRASHDKTVSVSGIGPEELRRLLAGAAQETGGGRP